MSFCKAWAGLEPAHSSFADCRVYQLRHQATQRHSNKKPPQDQGRQTKHRQKPLFDFKIFYGVRRVLDFLKEAQTPQITRSAPEKTKATIAPGTKPVTKRSVKKERVFGLLPKNHTNIATDTRIPSTIQNR